MHYEAKKEHLVFLFQQFARRLPPLIPKSIRENLAAANKRANDDRIMTTEAVEAELIYFAKQIWPYRRAFLDLYEMERLHMGEKFFLQGLPRGLKQKYQRFRTAGGNYADLRLGRRIDAFSIEERQALYPVFIAVDQSLFDYTKQRAITTGKKQYLEMVTQYQKDAEQFNFYVHRLQDMAIETELKTDTVDHLWSDVRTLEYGVSLLGPPISTEEAKTLLEDAKVSISRKYFR